MTTTVAELRNFASFSEELTKRAAPAVLVVDAFYRIVMANDQGMAVLRRLASDGEEPSDPAALPAVLYEALIDLAAVRRWRDDTSVAALALDLCVRVCRLSTATGPCLLLLFERPQRRRLEAADLSRHGITPRERETAMLVLQGLSNRTIAGRLMLSENTVESYVKQIFAKVGVRSRAGLVAKLLGWPSAG